MRTSLRHDPTLFRVESCSKPRGTDSSALPGHELSCLSLLYRAEFVLLGGPLFLSLSRFDGLHEEVMRGVRGAATERFAADRHQ